MRILFICLTNLTIAFASAWAASPPVDLEAFDTPNDAGGSITVTWPRSVAQEEDGNPLSYLVSIGIGEAGPFYPAAEVPAEGSLMADEPKTFGHGEETQFRHFVRVVSYEPADEEKPVGIEDDIDYYVKVSVRSQGRIEESGAVVSARSMGNLFNWAKFNNLTIGVVLSILVLVSISMARRRELYIRRIAGLEALDEALGRATEMGKAVLFIHGLREMDKISTIAAVNILGRVARRTAEFDTTLRVTSYDPMVMAVSQETVKEAYLEAGRPDAYNADNIFVAGTDQFSYAAAIEGMMLRERPAAHIMMGYFYAESLLLAETGSTTGAIQIAGSDAFTQLPFFVTTCDYTLMGEELYAASAYLSREPRLLGSLKGQDIGKGILILAIVFGTFLATLGFPQLAHVFSAY